MAECAVKILIVDDEVWHVESEAVAVYQVLGEGAL